MNTSITSNAEAAWNMYDSRNSLIFLLSKKPLFLFSHTFMTFIL